MLTSPALAQQTAAAVAPLPTQPPSPDTTANSLDAIVVTGSRIAGTGFTTPTPVTVVQAQQLIASSPGTVAQALNNLPSLYSNGGQQANGGSQSTSKNSLNLRNLGITRTLTLLDGHRFPATFTDNTVDTNLLPQGLIQRVEVVTGGASAAYGSDAVAGVVNFILDRNFTGEKAFATVGESGHGDGDERHYGVTFGRDVMGGRGHVLLDGEYFDSALIPGDARSFRTDPGSVIANPNASKPPTAANPSFIVAYHNVLTPGTYGGLITAASGGTAANNAKFVGIQFLPGGVAAPYNYGTLATATNQVGGDGVNTTVMQPINRALNRKSVFGRFSYEVSDNVNFYTEASFAQSQGTSTIVWYHTGGNQLTIKPDNAFLPASISSQMTALGVTSLTMTRFDSEPDTYTQITNYTTRLMAGFEGKLGNFKWEVFGQYGLNRQTSPNYGIYITSNYANAVDSVVNPANGQIVCRSTLTAPNNGCVPYNPFGQGSPSAAAVAYVNGTNWVRTRVSDDSAGANISGELFNDWAGPVSVATGVDWRDLRDKVVSNSFAPNGASIYFTGGVSPYTGAYTVSEIFGETEVPLAKDLPALRSLNLNAAVRYAHYSTDIGATTWKVGVDYKPISDLRFRVTRSHDIRAPNPNELFRTGAQSSGVIMDPFNGNVRVPGVVTISSGNPDLKPEVADTWVTGFVYEPSWLPGFDLSVDRYDIKIKDAIATLSGQQYVNECYMGAAELCANVIRNSAGVITQTLTTSFNFTSARASGIDFEADYRVPAQNWFDWWRGVLTIRGLAGYVGKSITQAPGAAPINYAGSLGNDTPHWRGLATANYDIGDWSSFLQMRIIGGGKWDITKGPADTNYNDIPSATYFDAQVAWHVRTWAEFDLNIQNLFDKQPLLVPNNGAYNVTTNSDLYDQIGRYFRLTLRVKH